MKKIYAFVPARSGSERVKNKNLKKIGKKPLLQYTIDQIINSKKIQKGFISTDYASLEKEIFLSQDIEIIKRPKSIAKSNSLDIDWILHSLDKLKNDIPDIIVILRPTSPFREPKFIDSSINKFINHNNYDSARAIKLVKEHPDKMWIKKDDLIFPYNGFKDINNEDLHSMQYKSLQEVYVQTSSLEILDTKSLLANKKLSGEKVLPLYSDFINSFTIDYDIDLKIADLIINKQL